MTLWTNLYLNFKTKVICTCLKGLTIAMGFPADPAEKHHCCKHIHQVDIAQVHNMGWVSNILVDEWKKKSSTPKEKRQKLSVKVCMCSRSFPSHQQHKTDILRDQVSSSEQASSYTPIILHTNTLHFSAQKTAWRLLKISSQSCPAGPQVEKAGS